MAAASFFPVGGQVCKQCGVQGQVVSLNFRLHTQKGNVTSEANCLACGHRWVEVWRLSSVRDYGECAEGQCPRCLARGTSTGPEEARCCGECGAAWAMPVRVG